MITLKEVKILELLAWFGTRTDLRMLAQKEQIVGEDEDPYKIISDLEDKGMFNGWSVCYYKLYNRDNDTQECLHFSFSDFGFKVVSIINNVFSTEIEGFKKEDYLKLCVEKINKMMV